MAQVTTLTDEVQTVTVTQASEYPVLYSGDQLLRQSILRIQDLHTVEPIDTVVFDVDSAPYINRLTVTLNDARVVRYRFEDVDPDFELFIMEFTGGAWEETSLDLLNDLKNGVLMLNKVYPMSGTDTYVWGSI